MRVLLCSWLGLLRPGGKSQGEDWSLSLSLSCSDRLFWSSSPFRRDKERGGQLGSCGGGRRGCSRDQVRVGGVGSLFWVWMSKRQMVGSVWLGILMRMQLPLIMARSPHSACCLQRRLVSFLFLFIYFFARVSIHFCPVHALHSFALGRLECESAAAAAGWAGRVWGGCSSFLLLCLRVLHPPTQCLEAVIVFCRKGAG